MSDDTKYPDGYYKIMCKSPWDATNTDTLSPASTVTIPDSMRWGIQLNTSNGLQFKEVDYESGMFVVEKRTWYASTTNSNSTSDPLHYYLKVMQHLPSTRYTDASNENRYTGTVGTNGYPVSSSTSVSPGTSGV
jgi:hypothetical protein